MNPNAGLFAGRSAALALFILFGSANGMIAQASGRAAELGGGANRPPNIVLIMTDDQGYGDLGVTDNPVLDTPHIDRLAHEAATMNTFYGSPYPAEITVAEVLRNAGYTTLPMIREGLTPAPSGAPIFGRPPMMRCGAHRAALAKSDRSTFRPLVTGGNETWFVPGCSGVRRKWERLSLEA